MKRLLITTLGLIAYMTVSGQELNDLNFGRKLTYLNHGSYDVIYSLDQNIPISVVYRLESPAVAAPRVERPADFSPDPLLAGSNLKDDYIHSGYSKGQMMSASTSRHDSIGMKESFYYVNVAPQTAKLNRGNWKRIENIERDLQDEYPYVKVLCGNFTTNNSTFIGDDYVAVPDYCWKILITPATTAKPADTLCYLFPNEDELSDDVETYRSSYKELEEYLPFSINEMIGMYESSDELPLKNFMISMLKKRIKALYESIPNEEELIDRIEYNVTDVDDLKSKFQFAGTSLPQDMAVKDYIREKFIANRKFIEDQYLALKKKIDLMDNSLSVFSLLSKPNVIASMLGICPKCDLPRTLPFCLFPRP